jgi:hypothetical protein
MRGRFVDQVEFDGPHWRCNRCRCVLFHVTPRGFYCAQCLQLQKAF